MGWNHRSSVHYGVDDFEQKKIDEHHEKKKLQFYDRLQVLAKYGYSMKDVIAAEKDRKETVERREQGLPELPDKEIDDSSRKGKSQNARKGLFSGFRKKPKA